MSNIFDLHIFKQQSVSGRILKPFICLAQKAFSEEPNSKSELAELVRNIEIATESSFGVVLKQHIHLLPFISVGINFTKNYFGKRADQETKAQYLVYTKNDHEIPFRPEYDTMYTYMYTQFPHLLWQLSNRLKPKDIRKLAKFFITINNLGGEVYDLALSRVLRPKNAKRLALKTIYNVFDRVPLNSCPSFHVTYTIALHNYVQNVLGLKTTKSKIAQDVRTTALETIDSVLYTKQHAIIDIPLGILTAQLAHRKTFPQAPFDNFYKELKKRENENPEIPYDKMKEMYARAVNLYNETKSLVKTIQIMFEQNKYPLVRNEEEAINTYEQLLLEWESSHC